MSTDSDSPGNDAQGLESGANITENAKSKGDANMNGKSFKFWQILKM